jgi:hypothetical protein
MSVARNLTRFFEIVIRFQRNRPDILYQETPPSSLNDGYPAGNAFQPSPNQAPLVWRPVSWIVVEELDHDRVWMKFKRPDLGCRTGCRVAPTAS